MAIHDFVCDKCGVSIQDNTTKGIHKCSICGEDMRLDCKIAIHGNYKRPVHSDALAIHPDQRAEHERLFPNIRVDKQNRPIFNNFVDHENYLNKCNLRKVRQKIRSEGQKISSSK